MNPYGTGLNKFGKILSELLLIIKYFYFAIIMDLYKNKFRIKSSRLKDWDYSTPWWYYVTICTKDMKCWFGEIRNGKMIYNQIGKKAVEYFENIPKHFLSSEIDYFIVMPNHVHGIIIINDTVETRHGVSLQNIRYLTIFFISLLDRMIIIHSVDDLYFPGLLSATGNWLPTKDMLKCDRAGLVL